MDVTSIGSVSRLALGAAESRPWTSALDIREVGQGESRSVEGQKMIDLYYKLRGLHENISYPLHIFAYAQLWHDEKDKSASVSKIIADATSSPRIYIKIRDFFDKKSKKQRSHYLTWSFNQQYPTHESFKKFASRFKEYLQRAANERPAVKTEMREAIWPLDLDSIILDWLYTIEDSKESDDLTRWRLFHKGWKKPGPRPPKG